MSDAHLHDYSDHVHGLGLEKHQPVPAVGFVYLDDEKDAEPNVPSNIAASALVSRDRPLDLWRPG